MECISIALTLADAIRQVLAAMKGETKLVVTCRQLLHSTQLYAECLTSLEQVTGGAAASSPQMKASLIKLGNMIENDVVLLREIKQEVDSIDESTAKKSFLHNVVISQWTGRIEKIRQLEAELMARFQVVTAVMMKEVYKSSNGLDDATMEMIGDVDGSIFWHNNFGQTKSTTFKQFLDSYQDYLSKTLFFRKLPRQHLQGMLVTTLLDEQQQKSVDNNTEVTVNMFAQWLKRYGPLRETLTKATILYQPSIEQGVPWFQKGVNRDQATFIIEHHFQKFSATNSLLPHHLLIVRYSSSPDYHFVVTCRHLNGNKMEHFPVINNGVKGYQIAGDNTGKTYPTLIEFIQQAVIDVLYAPLLGGVGKYMFPKDSVEEWDVLITQATAQLPVGHYGDRQALEKATQELSMEDGSVVSTISYGFGSLFTESSIPPPVLLSPSSVVTATTTTSVLSDHAMNLPMIEKRSIGKYMVRQGLALLVESGELSSDDAQIVFQMLNKVK